MSHGLLASVIRQCTKLQLTGSKSVTSQIVSTSFHFAYI